MSCLRSPILLVALLVLGCKSSSPGLNASNAAQVAGQALVNGGAAVAGSAIEAASRGDSGDGCPGGCPGELECIDKRCRLLPARKHPEPPHEYEVPPAPNDASPR